MRVHVMTCICLDVDTKFVLITFLNYFPNKFNLYFVFFYIIYIKNVHILQFILQLGDQS